jgi:hypothetical protein
VAIVEVVLAALLFAAALWRLVTPSEYKVRGVISGVCFGAAAWNVGAALTYVHNFPHSYAAALVELGMGLTAAFGLLAANLPAGESGRQTILVRTILIAEPILIAVLTAMRVGLTPGESYTSGFVHIAHLVFLSAIVMSIVVALASQSYAPGSAISIMLYSFQGLLVVIVATEALGLRAGSILSGVAALVAVVLSHKPSLFFVIASGRTDILDGLGAYVLAFDRDGFLRDWNAPTARLFEKCPSVKLREGASAQEILGTRVPLRENEIVTLETVDGPHQLHGYTVDASSPERKRGHRWVVVVQDFSLEVASSPARRGQLEIFSRAAITQRLRNAAVDPSGPVSMRIDISLPDGETMDAAIAQVAAQLRGLVSSVQIGRIEPLALVAIVPSRIDSQDVAEQLAMSLHNVSIDVSLFNSDPHTDPDAFIHQVLHVARAEGKRRWQPQWY